MTEQTTPIENPRDALLAALIAGDMVAEHRAEEALRKQHSSVESAMRELNGIYAEYDQARQIGSARERLADALAGIERSTARARSILAELTDAFDVEYVETRASEVIPRALDQIEILVAAAQKHAPEVSA